MDARVADILFAMCPDFPIPQQIIFPVILYNKRQVFTKALSRLVFRSFNPLISD